MWKKEFSFFISEKLWQNHTNKQHAKTNCHVVLQTFCTRYVFYYCISCNSYVRNRDRRNSCMSFIPILLKLDGITVTFYTSVTFFWSTQFILYLKSSSDSKIFHSYVFICSSATWSLISCTFWVWLITGHCDWELHLTWHWLFWSLFFNPPGKITNGPLGLE